jgi:hypothetical protein
MLSVTVLAVGLDRYRQASVKAFLVVNVIENIFMIMALHA